MIKTKLPTVPTAVKTMERSNARPDDAADAEHAEARHKGLAHEQTDAEQDQDEPNVVEG